MSDLDDLDDLFFTDDDEPQGLVRPVQGQEYSGPGELEVVETERPAGGLQHITVSRRRYRPPSPDHVRRAMTYSLLFVFAFTIGAPWFSLWIGTPDSPTVERVFPIITGQVLGLLGAVTGFYFGERSAEKAAATVAGAEPTS